MAKHNDAVYIISVAAELAGVHPQTLRIYERKGLIEPYRTPGGTRRYSRDDLERLELIHELTSAGVNLEGVRRILTLREDNKRLRTQVDRMRRLLVEAEQRITGQGAATGPSVAGDVRARRVTVTTRRNLPDIRRSGPFG